LLRGAALRRFSRFAEAGNRRDDPHAAQFATRVHHLEKGELLPDAAEPVRHVVL
jgi:hypothetical protein